jgi:DNA-binding SARP family transcriptional activator
MVADSLRVHLLGSFRLLHRAEVVKGFDQARLQELLAYLLLHRSSPVPRQQLAFLFWPDSTEEQARTNFRTLWHRLRRALPDADRFLSTDELTVQWHSDEACWSDVAAFEAGLQQARSAVSLDEQIAALEQAVALYGGELLPGCYSDWLLAERDRLAQAYGAALAQLAALHEERRDYRQAIGHAQALLRHDPLHEPVYAQLMRLHALNDDRAAALHTYHTCATVLRRELDVKPGPATRELYERLLKVTPQPVAPAQTEAVIPLVGREAEWVQLQHAWRAAAHRPRLALIAGEAGIGKTRLAETLAEWVARQGIPALTARCYPQGAGGELAYAPVVTWLRGHPRPPLADPWLRELARLLPEILVEHPDLPPPEPLTEKWQRLRLFEALTHAVLAGHAALMLTLDDLQWCDRDTLDWLHYLLTAHADQDKRTQLLVVATLRSEESETGSALAAWRAALARAGPLVAIELGPLSPDATLALADRVAGRPLDRGLGPLLYQGTEGHPLFIVEMVRAGFAQNSPAPTRHAAAMMATPAALPAKVRQVLEARLAQLSPPARGLIELAAVVGRAFSFSVLVQAADVSEDLLVACLDECWRKRIVRELGENAYDFSHDKLREAAYAGLSRTRRRWLHGRVAQALEIVHAADLEHVAGLVAEHYEAAKLIAPAIAYYDRAAAAASRVYAYQDALAALEKAISLLEALPDPVARCKLAAHLQEVLGDLRELLTQHGPARDAYAAALACAPDADTVAQARLHRKIGKTLESERAAYAQVAARYETAEALLGAQSRDDADVAWWEEWCQIQIEHLILLYWWRQPGEMAERIARVRSLIESHGTPAQRAALFGNLNRQLNQSNRFAPSDTALGYARAALEALPPPTSPALRAPYQFALGFNLLWHGDLAEAEVELRAALDMAEQIGDVSLQTRCLAYLVVVHRRQGHETEVEAYARRGLAVAESAGMLEYIGANQAGLAWLAGRRDDTFRPGSVQASTSLSANLAETERLGQAALAAWRLYAMPYPFYWQALWPLIGVALVQDHPADAISYTRQLCDSSQQLLPATIEAPLVAALAAWDAGQTDEVRDLLCRALDVAQQINLS